MSDGRLKACLSLAGLGWLVVLCLWSGFWLSSETGRAQEQRHAAGLIIDYGDGRMSYAWVPFTGESITGIELLRQSGLSLVTVPFGGLGEGVCSIEGTGCGTGDCRSRLCQTADRDSPFWQYVQQDEEGIWHTAALGAGQSTVEDGDIDGWSWTGSPPKLSAVSMADIAAHVGLPPEGPGQTGSSAALNVTEGGAPRPTGARTWSDAVPAAWVIAGTVAIGFVAIWRHRRHPDVHEGVS